VDHITLDLSIREAATDQTLGVEDGVFGVGGRLVLGSITDKTLSISEGNIRGSGTVTLLVGDDLNTIILVDTDARVGGTQINTDARPASLSHCVVS